MTALGARQGAQAEGAPLLAVEELAVAFPTRAGPLVALDGVSYRLARGRTLGIVGESGSGKSVLALALLNLIPPPGRILHGSVRLDGIELASLGEAELAALRGDRVAIVFQEPMTALNPVFTVGEQIAEALRLHRGLTHGEARAEAVAALARVGIAAPALRARDYPHQLSGGMRQRAMIAMALACEPDLLAADEPTTALDVTIQAQILELMLETQGRLGMAIQFVSHDMAVISEVADEVGVMYAGRLVEHARRTRSSPSPFIPIAAPSSRACRASAVAPQAGAAPLAVPAALSAPVVPAAFRARCRSPMRLPLGRRFSDRCRRRHCAPGGRAGARGRRPGPQGRLLQVRRRAAPLRSRGSHQYFPARGGGRITALVDASSLSSRARILPSSASWARQDHARARQASSTPRSRQRAPWWR